MITTIIRTLNRSTLNSAIESALKEKFKVIVVVDSSTTDTLNIPISQVKLVKMHHKFNEYNNAGINLGAYLSDTEYINILDDDDEFRKGSGDLIREHLKKTKVDILIPGLRFKTRPNLCMSKKLGCVPGNVACPTYRTTIFGKVPFKSQSNIDYSDYLHVLECVSMGYTIDWIEKEIILVRPKIDGDNGRGS